MAHWITENPGRRPAAWWGSQSPEPLRRQLGGSGVLVGQRYRNLIVPPELGIPAFDSVDSSNPPVFESQATFLQRHNLLTTSELRRLRPADFEPETLDLE